MPNSIKKIKGIEYLYYTYYINGKRHDVYCGLATKKESKKKALETELYYVQEQIAHYKKRQTQLEKKLN